MARYLTDQAVVAFCASLVKARASNGLAQHEVGQLVGLKQSDISFIERHAFGERFGEATKETMERIAGVLSVPVPTWAVVADRGVEISAGVRRRDGSPRKESQKPVQKENQLLISVLELVEQGRLKAQDAHSILKVASQ